MPDLTKHSVLKTERLNLGPLTEAILEDVYHIRTLPSTTQFLSKNANVFNETREDYFQRIMEGPKKGTSIQWIIHFEDQVVGSICLWNFKQKAGQAEIGYDLHPDFHGKGIMTEALQKVIEVGFNELGQTSLIAYTNEKNYPSRALLERCGFQFQGKDDDPKFPDDVIYKRTVLPKK